MSIAFLGISPGAPEMLLIFVMILLLFGAKNVPKIARSLGRTLEEFRRAARDVSDEIMQADEDIREELRTENYFDDEDGNSDDAYYEGYDGDVCDECADPSAYVDDPSTESTDESGTTEEAAPETDETAAVEEAAAEPAPDDGTGIDETVERKPADG